LIGFLINGFFWEKMSKSLSGGIACVSVLASFIISVLAFIELHHSATKSMSLIYLPGSAPGH